VRRILGKAAVEVLTDEGAQSTEPAQHRRNEHASERAIAKREGTEFARPDRIVERAAALQDRVERASGDNPAC
jgi:hypothetical protein